MFEIIKQKGFQDKYDSNSGYCVYMVMFICSLSYIKSRYTINNSYENILIIK